MPILITSQLVRCKILRNIKNPSARSLSKTKIFVLFSILEDSSKSYHFIALQRYQCYCYPSDRVHVHITHIRLELVKQNRVQARGITKDFHCRTCELFVIGTLNLSLAKQKRFYQHTIMSSLNFQ